MRYYHLRGDIGCPDITGDLVASPTVIRGAPRRTIHVQRIYAGHSAYSTVRPRNSIPAQAHSLIRADFIITIIACAAEGVKRLVVNMHESGY